MSGNDRTLHDYSSLLKRSDDARRHRWLTQPLSKADNYPSPAWPRLDLS